MFIKPTPISYCQSCGRDFRPQEIVYFAPVDNTIVCVDCAKVHKKPEPRIYGKDAGLEGHRIYGIFVGDKIIYHNPQTRRKMKSKPKTREV